MVKKERGLGRGLEALFSPGVDEDSAQVLEINLDLIIPRGDQPRKKFNNESLLELAESIKEHGVLQPVLVRPVGESYEIIAGERRWRATKMAGLDTIPVIVKEMEDIQAAEVSLIENLQRDDLSVLEEANAYKNILEKYNYTQEALASRIGKSRAHVANTIRILGLPEIVLEMVSVQKLSAGHARALLSLDSAYEQVSAAKEIISGKLSVRQAEETVKFRKHRNAVVKGNKSPEILEVEERLQKHFGTRAEIIGQLKGGKIEIGFYNEEDLERILEIMGLS